MRRLIAHSASTLVLGAALVVLWSTPASACSCAGGSEAAAFHGADAVFTADLVEVDTPESGDVWSSADPEHFVFEVDRVYKGEVAARQPVETAREGASCGLELRGTGPFLVFARTDMGRLDADGAPELISGLCDGSRPLHEPVPEDFGRGAVPVVNGASRSPEPPSSGGTRSWGPIAAGVVATGIGVVSFMRWRATGPTTSAPTPP